MTSTPQATFIRPVFISHAEEDSEIAFSVAAVLRRRLTAEINLDKFFLTAGAKWKERIEDRIRSSEVLIVLISRITSNSIAPGVEYELELASRYNIPVIFGLIRGSAVPDRYEDYQFVDFGERGDREEAAWDIARALLLNSSPFAPLGLSEVFATGRDADSKLKSTTEVATSANSVIVVGHTLQAWLANYQAPLREATAEVHLYIPADDSPGNALLDASHRRGSAIRTSILETHARLLDLVRELGPDSCVKCYTLPVKPMFSLTAVDVDSPVGMIIVDHYLYKISSGMRPRMILRGPSTPIYSMYRIMLAQLTASAIRMMP